MASLDAYLYPKLKTLTPDRWNAFVAAIQADLGDLQERAGVEERSADAIIQRGVDIIIEQISPVVLDADQKQLAIAAQLLAMQNIVADAQAILDTLNSGGISADVVAPTADRIWLTPTLQTAWNAKVDSATLAAYITAAAAAAAIASAIAPLATTAAVATALSGKSNVGHSHPAADISGIGSVVGGGLAIGGGSLPGSRTITVPKSTQEQAEGGTDDETAMTPLGVNQAMTANPNLDQWIAGGETTSGTILGVDLSAAVARGLTHFSLDVEYRPSSNNKNLDLNWSTNGGSSIITTGTYRGVAHGVWDDGTTPEVYADSWGADTSLRLFNAVSNGSDIPNFVRVEITVGPTFVRGFLQSFDQDQGGPWNGSDFAFWNKIGNVNAFRLTHSGGGSIALLRWAIKGWK